MSFSFPRHALVAIAVALALATLLVSPTTARQLAQDDSGAQSSGDESMQDEPVDDTAAPPAVSATSLDPCQIVTSAEASALAGANFTTGIEQTTDGGGRICVYGYQTQNVFMVLVAQGPDAAT